jgi:hypothetical protein
VTGIGGLVVGLGAIAVAWYKGSQEAGEFNKQLILTGNYSAKSASQLTDLAQKIGGSSGKVAAAARTLAEVVGAGTFKTDSSKQSQERRWLCRRPLASLLIPLLRTSKNYMPAQPRQQKILIRPFISDIFAIRLHIVTGASR